MQETFTLQLTAPQLQVIGNAMSVRPYHEVADVLQSIKTQVAAQQQAAHDKAADAAARPSGASAPAGA